MDILFWSGGKDSYLAYQFYKKSFPERSIALLTTYHRQTGFVPHQQIPIKRIKAQAEHLNLTLYTVPLPSNASNETYLKAIDKTFKNIPQHSKRLIFGDRLSPEIQNWREEKFNKRAYECYFPIEEKKLDELLSELEKHPVEVRISAVQESFQHKIKVGDAFNSHLVKQLPENIDPMGEKGEFHTEVYFDFCF